MNMKNMKKKIFLAALCVVAMTALMFMSCDKDNGKDSGDNNDEGLIVVGFSQVGAESDWRVANTRSMKNVFSKENGYKLILEDAQQKPENQITAIEKFIEQKVDYIVFAPKIEEGWDNVLKKAKAAGIPVIIVDRMIKTSDESLYTCFVGSDFRKEGDIAVAWLETMFKDKPDLKIVHLKGDIGSSAQIGRTEGLLAGVERNSGWEIIYSETGEFNELKGKERMEYVLKQYDEIDVLYCENDNMAFGAIKAMDTAKKTYGVNGDVTVISFDATKLGLEATLGGKINYNVECNPLHGPRVEAIIKQLKNGETPDKRVYVEEAAFDAAVITQEDIDAREY